MNHHIIINETGMFLFHFTNFREQIEQCHVFCCYHFQLQQQISAAICVSTRQRQVAYIAVQRINWRWLYMHRIYRLTMSVQEWVCLDGREGDIAIARWDLSVGGLFGSGTVYPTYLSVCVFICVSKPLVCVLFSYISLHYLPDVAGSVRIRLAQFVI